VSDTGVKRSAVVVPEKKTDRFLRSFLPRVSAHLQQAWNTLFAGHSFRIWHIRLIPNGAGGYNSLMSLVRVAALPSHSMGSALGRARICSIPWRPREEIFGWFFPTRTFQKMHGSQDGARPRRQRVGDGSFENVGAWTSAATCSGPSRPVKTTRGKAGGARSRRIMSRSTFSPTMPARARDERRHHVLLL